MIKFNEKLLCKFIEKAEKNSFYMSLMKQYNKTGNLSPKQLFYVYKLEREETNPELKAENSPYKGKIVKLPRFIASKLKETHGEKEVFIVNQITKVHRETHKAILVDLSNLAHIVLKL